jgi:2-oxoglutarate ferredoxin oxidoreductase subunit alpha
VDVQRMGPATGGATTVAQGDVQFLRWGTSGGYPVIVLAPTSVADCYFLTQRAFDLAERFRVPVFLATDKETVLSQSSVEVADFTKLPVRSRLMAPEGGKFIPYKVGSLDDVPPMTVYGGSHLLRFTTSTHDEYGHLTEKPEKVRALNQRLADKIDHHLDEIALVAADMQPGAETLILSYGVTARAAAEAVKIARHAGKAVSSLTIYSLWPLPVEQIRQALAGIRRVVVPELNLGQYRLEIERLVQGKVEVVGVHRVDGQLITPQEILEHGGLQ